jgi:hypothetical protein
MRHYVQYVSAVLVAMAMMIASSSSAQAQTRSEFSAGYQVTHVPDLTLPAGWYADISVPLVPMFNVVGEVSGAYKSESLAGVSTTAKLHTFLGGVRFTGRGTPTVVPFGQVLIGAAKLNFGVNAAGASILSGSDTEFALQLGGGVNVMASPRVGVRAGVDYRRIFTVDENEVRFAFGIVLPFGK